MRLCFGPGPLETKSPVTEPGAHALLCAGTPSTSGVLIRGDPSPVPMCPSGRILVRPERARMRLPSPKGGPIHWRNFGKSSKLPKHDKQCHLPVSEKRCAESAVGRKGDLRYSPDDCPERRVRGQAPGSASRGSRDPRSHRRRPERSRRIRRMSGDDFASGGALGHRRHTLGRKSSPEMLHPNRPLVTPPPQPLSPPPPPRATH